MLLNTDKTASVTLSLKKTICTEAIDISDTAIQKLTTAKLFGVDYEHTTLFALVDNVLLRATPSLLGLVQLK